MKNSAYCEIDLTITKAAVQPNGSIRWQAVASDTGLDRVEERTSLPLFQDWIERVEKGLTTPFLPDAPRMPFLGLSHYPALGGLGEAGPTIRMYIDGDRFKADGNFYQDEFHPLGPSLFGAIATERALLKRGEAVDNPIRISAAWWDLQHAHGDFVFTRRSLADRCPLCDQGVKDKVYLKGQLDHFAATRVPMNPRTDLTLEEKSMKKITRKEDAASIIDDDLLVEALDKKARLVGKADTDLGVDPAALVIRATSLGDYLRQKREALELSLEDAAAELDLEADDLSAIEAGKTVFPAKEVLSALAKLYKVEADELIGMLPKPKRKADLGELGSTETSASSVEPLTEVTPEQFNPAQFDKLTKKAAMMKTVDGEDYPASDFLVVEDPEGPSTWHLQVRRQGEIDHRLMGAAWAALHGGYRGNKYEGPEKGKALATLKKLYKAEEMPMPNEKSLASTLPQGQGSAEKMGNGHFDRLNGEGMEAYPEMPKPLGGALSIDEAETYLDSNEKMRRLYSNWDIFNQVTGNIMADEEMAPADRIKALGTAIEDFGDRVAALKASLADAFLLTQSAADEWVTADGYNEVITETPVQAGHNEGSNIMSIETTVDGIVANGALSKEQKAAAIQEAFQGYAETVKGKLDTEPAAPPDPAATLKGALAEALSPLTEQLGLLIAKLAQPTQAQPQMTLTAWPQQKSLAPGYQPQIVDDGPAKKIMSPLTAAIRRSVGIVE